MDFPINRSLDPFARLPPELCAAVLSLLPDEDLITVSHVSSFLRSQCLDDSLYAAPVKPRLEALLRNATSFPGDISSYTPAKIRELVRKLPYTSGTSYFDNIDTIRDFFLRQHFLKKSWGSGRPPRVTKLHSHDGHRSPVDKLAIDPTFNQIISIDREGLVCFWDIETSATTKAFRLEPSSTAVWATQGGLMALKDDVLLVGIATRRSIHICIRDPPSVPVGTRGFTPASSFTVADPVRSILLEGSVCILGCCGGGIEFWDLQREERQSQSNGIEVSIVPRKCLRISSLQHRLSVDRNRTLYYRRPYLLLPSIIAVRISPRNKDDNKLLDLWEYSAEDIVWDVYTHMITYDDLPHQVSLRNIKISPVGWNGSVLLALPNSSVFRIDCFWDIVGHTVEGVLLASGPEECQLGSLAAIDGYFLVTYTQGQRAWHKQPVSETIVCLYHENGDPISEYVGYSPIRETIMDPCIFVSAGNDRNSRLTVMDFRPQARPDNGPKEGNVSGSVKRRRALDNEGGKQDIGPTPRLMKRNRKKRANAPSSKRTAKAPNRSPAEIINTPEDTPIPSMESTGVSTQAASNNANTTIEQPQGGTISWGEAALRALISHSGARGGLLASEILGLVLCSGLREIMVGQENDVLKEVEEALDSASQSSEVPIESVTASRNAKPKYRSSRSRRGAKG